MKSVVVLSGGLDSTVALHHALLKPRSVIGTLTFNYGSKHNDREYEMARFQSKSVGVENVRVDLTAVGQHLKSDLLKSGGEIPEGHYADPSMKKTVVPFRNGIMLSIAAGIAESMGAMQVILGNHFGDHAIYPDCREAFVRPMARAIKIGTYAGIKLVTPFSRMTKTDIVRIGEDLGVDFQNTYSCYNGREKHCGKCGTCFERIEAFKLAGVPDPTEYE